MPLIQHITKKKWCARYTTTILNVKHPFANRAVGGYQTSVDLDQYAQRSEVVTWVANKSELRRTGCFSIRRSLTTISLVVFGINLSTQARAGPFTTTQGVFEFRGIEVMGFRLKTGPA